MIGLVNTIRRPSNISSSCVDGKERDSVFDLGSNRTVAELFYLPFQISYHIMAFIFNKNEGNNQKVENKVSGKVRVCVGTALLSQ